MMGTIGIGFALAKSGVFPPSAAKGVSIIALVGLALGAWLT
jgi:hypothetical protein